MPTEPRRRQSFAFPRHAVSVIGLLAGVFVLGLAAPRTIAAFQLLPGNLALDGVRSGKAVSGEDLQAVISSRDDAFAWLPSPRIQGDLALAHLALAGREGYGGSETGGRHLSDGLHALEAGLSLSPANPYAWARLAFVRIKNGGSATDVKRALFLSFLTGPYERRLAVSRIQYAILLWDRFDADERSLVLDQISWAERAGKRRALVAMAERDRKADAVLFLAIARDTKRLRGYLRNLNTLKKRKK